MSNLHPYFRESLAAFNAAFGPCSVERATNRHYSRLDEDVRFNDAVEERTEFLLREDEYYPFDQYNFAEALCESNMDSVRTLFAQGKEAEAGVALAKVVRDYWYDAAHREATRQIENEKM